MPPSRYFVTLHFVHVVHKSNHHQCVSFNPGYDDDVSTSGSEDPKVYRFKQAMEI